MKKLKWPETNTFYNLQKIVRDGLQEAIFFKVLK